MRKESERKRIFSNRFNILNLQEQWGISTHVVVGVLKIETDGEPDCDYPLCDNSSHNQYIQSVIGSLYTNNNAVSANVIKKK